jgi:hypothetical protein
VAVDDMGKLTDHVSLGVLTKIVPRYVVDEILAETGSVEKRSRLLPAHVVVYFVLALSLFTDGYEEIIRKLVHGLRFAPNVVEGVEGADYGCFVSGPGTAG